MLEKFLENFYANPKARIAFIAVMIAVFLLTVAGSAVVAFLTPNSYEGVVRLQTDTQTDGVSNLVKCVTSESVLYPVISDLGLRRKWGATHSGTGELDLREAYTRLVRQIEIKRIPRVTLTDLRVFDPDNQAAADIANAIADSYTRAIEAEQWKGVLALQKDLNITKQDISRLRRSLAEKAREAGMVETTQGWTNAPAPAAPWLALERETLNKKTRMPDANASELAKDLELAEKYRPFYEAEQNLRLTEQVAAALKLRASAEAAQAQLRIRPHIVDMAVPQPFHARPNRPLMIIIGIAWGTPLALLLGVVSALLVLLIPRRSR